MPIVACVDLKLHQPSRTLVVGTYGRSMYKINLDQLLGIQPPQQQFTFAFSVFPNPVTSEAVTTTMTLSESGGIALSLFDVDGKIIREEKENGVKGKRSMKFDLKNISSGVYFLQLKTENQSATQKIIVP